MSLWFIWTVDKIRRGFLWKDREQVNGGNCLAAWHKVQRPLDLGGLVVLNLDRLSSIQHLTPPEEAS